LLLFRDGRAGAADAETADAAHPEDQSQKPWRVLLHNDPVTPMEYVVRILEDGFGLGWFQATRVMLTAHLMGRALVGVYAREEARGRVDAAHDRARVDSWPLRFSCEPAE
jgi:ATP-dependent Clp protease adaptor protein ClpS